MSKYGDNRTHAYDSYISSTDWTEKIIEKEQKESLLEGIESYLERKYDYRPTDNRKPAYLKSLELIEGEKGFEQENISEETKRKIRKADPVVTKSQRKRKLVLKKLVKNAEEKGFLEDFRLSNPWHHKPFLEGNFVSYPYQHNTAILYRGVSKRPFKKQEHKSESSYNVQSILEQGYLDTVTGTGEGYVWTFPFFQEEGVGPLNWGSSDGAVLEIQVPTKWIELGKDIQNLNDIQQRFGSPENFREWLIENKGNQSLVAFKIPHRVPINYITGVHDREICETGEFIPLESENQRDYIDVIKTIAREKVPEKPSLGKGYKDGELYQEASRHAENSELRIELIELTDHILEKYYTETRKGQSPHFQHYPHGIYFAILSALNDIMNGSEEIIDEKKKSTEKGLIGKLLSSENSEKIINEIEGINERIEFCYRNYSQLEERELSKVVVENDEELISVLKKYIDSIEANLGNNWEELRNEIRNRKRELEEIKSGLAKDENIDENIKEEIRSFKNFENRELENVLESLSIIQIDYNV